jgi:hypothetical protein
VTTTATIEALHPYELSRLAEVTDPDSDVSEGAKFLSRVRDDVVSYWADQDSYGDPDDVAHEIADGCVPVYTHNRWLTVVDLCAYQEDVSELAGDSGSMGMTELAGIALYQVAERLFWALVKDLRETEDEAEDVTV